MNVKAKIRSVSSIRNASSSVASNDALHFTAPYAFTCRTNNNKLVRYCCWQALRVSFSRRRKQKQFAAGAHTLIGRSSIIVVFCGRRQYKLEKEVFRSFMDFFGRVF